MSAKKTVIGPYKVINISNSQNGVWEVVETQNVKGDYSELRPRRTYLKRQSAYGMCRRLNARWQEECALDENYGEMLKIFA